MRRCSGRWVCPVFCRYSLRRAAFDLVPTGASVDFRVEEFDPLSCDDEVKEKGCCAGESEEGAARFCRKLTEACFLDNTGCKAKYISSML